MLSDEEYEENWGAELALLRRAFESETRGEVNTLIGDHPELLDEDVRRLLNEMVMRAVCSQSAGWVRVIGGVRDFLRDAQVRRGEGGRDPVPWVGAGGSEVADEVFTDLIRPDLETAATVFVEAARFAQLIDDYLNAELWEPAGRLIADNPELLDERTELALEELEGDVDRIAGHLRLLLRYRESGAGAVEELEDAVRRREAEEREGAVSRTIPPGFEELFGTACEVEEWVRNVSLNAPEAVRAWAALIDDPEFPETPDWFRLIVAERASIAYERQLFSNGSNEALDGCIRTGMLAVSLADEESPDLASRRSLLADHLRDRYERHGSKRDLQDAVRFYMLVAGLRPGDPGSAATTTDLDVLSGLGATLGARYDLLGDPADLELSVELLQMAAPDEEPAADRDG